MFHVFSGHPETPDSSSSCLKIPVEKRPRSRGCKIPHACIECKRRKIRCDGASPCSRCSTRGLAHSCGYARHRERMHPSKQKVEKLSRSLEEHRTIVDRLFPDHEVSELLSLPRDELLSIVNTPRMHQYSQPWLPPPSETSSDMSLGSPCSEHNPFAPAAELFKGIDIDKLVEKGITWEEPVWERPLDESVFPGYALDL